MKLRVWFTVAFLISLPVLLNAQVIRNFGVKFGAARANQSWDYSSGFFQPNIDLDSRFGLDVGVFFELANLRVVSVLVEAHYIQKGFSEKILVTTKENPDGTGEFMEFKPRVDYLSFPVLARFKAPVLLSPYIIVGPRVDVRIGHDAEAFQSVYDALKRFDVGAAFGLGVEVHELSSVGLIAELRYSPSFTTAFENENLTVKNESIEFLVGVGF